MCIERDDAGKVEKRQQLLTERLETSEIASRQWVKDVKLLQELRSKVSIVTSEPLEWRELATETAEKLKVVGNDFV